MTKVYVLQHSHSLDDGDEDVKLIGCYSSTASAAEAIERLRRKPGFSEAPDGFSVDEYELDVDHWTEGFVTVAP